jgi:hypothetical protein
LASELALQRLDSGRRKRRCPGLQPQTRKDLLDHRLLQDRRNDLQLASAVRAVLQVEVEQALEQLGPLRRTGRWCAQLGVGGQHAMEPNQVQTRAGHQRRLPLNELQRRNDQMRGAVAPGGLELEHHLPGGVPAKAVDVGHVG